MAIKRILVVALGFWFSLFSMENTVGFYQDPCNPTMSEVKNVCNLAQTCKKAYALVIRNNWFVQQDYSIDFKALDSFFCKFARKKSTDEEKIIYALKTTSMILFHYKFKCENERVVKFLALQGAGIASGTLFTNACWKGRIDIVKILLDHGYPLNYGDDCGAPLSYACIENRFAVVKLLLERGADINIGRTAVSQELAQTKLFKEWEYMPPLIYACSASHFNMAQFLIEEGADLNVEYAELTPLQAAMVYKDVEENKYRKFLNQQKKVIKLLLCSKGLKLSLKDYERAKKYLKKHKYPVLFEVLEKKWVQQQTKK